MLRKGVARRLSLVMAASLGLLLAAPVLAGPGPGLPLTPGLGPTLPGLPGPPHIPGGTPQPKLPPIHAPGIPGGVPPVGVPRLPRGLPALPTPPKPPAVALPDSTHAYIVGLHYLSTGSGDYVANPFCAHDFHIPDLTQTALTATFSVTQGTDLVFRSLDNLQPHTVTSDCLKPNSSQHFFDLNVPNPLPISPLGGASLAGVGILHTGGIPRGSYTFYCRHHLQMLGLLKIS